MSFNIAIIGYGGMGGWHADFIRSSLPEMNLKGVWDIRPERLEAAREKGIFTYESEKQLLFDPEIDLVTIATPNNFHKPLAIKALNAGKNVISEKPVMMNAAELEEVMKAAEKSGKVFTVHQNRRWDKDFCTVKNIIDGNIIGKPHFIESRVLGSRRVLCGWRGYKIDGGGMLLDWGVHLIDQLMWMNKTPVVNVYAELLTIAEKCEVDDNIKIHLTFADGLHAMVQVANHCFIPLPRWHVSCEYGTAVVEDWDANGKIVRLASEDEMAWDESICYTAAGPTRTMAPRPTETIETLELPVADPHLTDFYRNVAAATRGEAELIVKPGEALRVMKVIDLAFESGEKKKSISCLI